MHSLRLNQLASVFSKADSALASRRVSVTIMEHRDVPETPAWTERGNLVTIVEAGAQNLTSTAGLVVANGLNYHELCHVMFTPMSGSKLFSRVHYASLGHVYNVLEDQRIESIMARKYAPTVPYLIATVAEYFIAHTDDEQKSQSWPILYGRRYLPSNLRAHFRAAYLARPGVTDAKVKKIEALIDEYRMFRFGKSPSEAVIDRAITVMMEFAKLTGMQANQMPPNPFAHGQHTVTGHGGDAGAAGQPGGDQGDADGDGDGDDGKGAGSGKGNKGKKAPGGGTGKQQAGDDADGAGNGKGGSDDVPDSDGGHGAGADGKDGTGLHNALKDATRNVMSDSRVMKEVEQQRRVILGKGDMFNGLDLPDVGVMGSAPSIQAVSSARAFSKQLQRLVSDEDPGWDKHRDSGRLNINRAMRGDSLDSVFDQWSEGKMDAESIELVILLDASSSMDGMMGSACEAAWSLKAGMDKLGGQARSSVITFSTDASYLYRPNDKASMSVVRRCGTRSATRAKNAVAEASNIFALSSRRKKILVMVSDGQWADAAQADPLVARLNEAGVVTASLLLLDTTMYLETAAKRVGLTLDQYINREMRHCAQHMVTGHDTGAIASLGKALVKAAIKS